MNLYPRRSAGSTDRETTDKAMAHRMLDRYRAGERMPQSRVDWALRMTGDLTADTQSQPTGESK